MHELSIALSIIDGVVEEARREGLSRIEKVHLRIGRLSGVDKEALRFSYDIAAEDTPLAGTQLVIEDVDVVIECPTCRAERSVQQLPLLACPECGAAPERVVCGDELEISGLELAA